MCGCVYVCVCVERDREGDEKAGCDRAELGPFAGSEPTDRGGDTATPQSALPAGSPPDDAGPEPAGPEPGWRGLSFKLG